MRTLLLVALVGALAFAGAAAQDDDVHVVEGFQYLYSTDLYKKQSGDVVRSFDTLFWDNGQNPKGMHKCARLCKKEGGGGVCASWSFCWSTRRCSLLSRLPSSLEPAKPGAVAGAFGNAYDAKCASGYSQAAALSATLAVSCKATISANTVFTDTFMSTATNRNKPLKADYDPNQPSASECCALCASLKDKGCTSWSYDPSGWMIDRSRKCTLRTGVNPALSTVKGATSGVMQ